MHVQVDTLSVAAALEEALPAAPGAADVFSLVYRQMDALVGRRSPEFDDLVQSAAEQVLLALPSFERRARFSTWTYRICYLTMLKRQRWYRRWLRRFTLTHDGELPDTLEGSSPSAPLELDERIGRLRAAIDRLSPKRRTVLVLHDLEQLPVNEIAMIVEANTLTVRSRLRDGRKDLARLLAEDPYFGDAACAAQEDS